MDLVGELNRLAGFQRPDWRGAAGAANAWAGTTGYEVVGALNVKAGTWGLELAAVLKRLGYNLDPNGALVGTADGTSGVANTLRLPGLVGNYMTTPDTAAISVTGDIDIRVRVAMDTWRPHADVSLLENFGASNGYRILVRPSGVLRFDWGNGTSDTFGPSSSSPINASDGAVKWIRATLDVDDGGGNRVLTYYTSDDGSTWAQLSTHTTAGTTTIANAQLALEIGRRDHGSTVMTAAHVYYVEVRSGINGNVVAKFDSATVAVRGDRTPTTHTQASAAEAIRLPGVAGNYLSIADSPAVSTTGDIDLRAHVALDDWSPATNQAFIGKYGTAGNRSYLFWIRSADRRLELYLSADGTNAVNVMSDVATNFADGSAQHVRATWRQSDGRLQFFTSSDGITWAQLGTDRTLAVASIYDSPQTLELGAWQGGTGTPMAGQLFSAQVRSGIDGPIVASFNAANTTPTDMRTPATADGWTINGSAWAWHAPLAAPSAGALRLPGTTGNYVSTPDAADISITGDIDLRAKVTLDNWATGSFHTVLAKYSITGNQRGYRLRVTSTGGLDLTLSTLGIDAPLIDSSATMGLTAGSTKWIRATWRMSDGRVQFFTSDDGSAWNQLGVDRTLNAGVAIFDSTAVLEMMSNTSGGDTLATGYVHRGEVWSGIGGTLVAWFDADSAPITGSRTPTTVVQSGRTWTLNGAAWSWVSVPDPTEWTVNGSSWHWGTYTGTKRFDNYIQLDPQYVQFPGTSTNYASTPDSAALSITGDIDVRAKIQPETWRPASSLGAYTIIGKDAGGSDRSWYMYLHHTGVLGLATSLDGSNFVFPSFSHGLTGNGVKWVRMTRESATGLARGYHSDDGVNWTQFGVGSATAGAIYDSTASVTIGGRGATGNIEPFAGKVYYAEIRNGIGGALAGVFTPWISGPTAERTPNSFNGQGSSSGELWTVNGTGWTWGPFTTRPLIITPDSAALSVTGDIDIRAHLTVARWRDQAEYIVVKRDGVAGYGFRIAAGWVDGRLEFIWGDGSANRFASSSTSLPFTDGQRAWVRVTLDVDNGSGGHTVTFYTSSDGVTWTQLGATQNAGAFTTSIADGTSPLSIGSDAAGGMRLHDARIHYAEIRSGIGGAVVGVFDPNKVRLGMTPATTPTTVPSTTGETYSITGSGWSWNQDWSG